MWSQKTFPRGTLVLSEIHSTPGVVIGWDHEYNWPVVQWYEDEPSMASNPQYLRIRATPEGFCQIHRNPAEWHHDRK